MKRLLPLYLSAAAIALAGCTQDGDSNTTAPAEASGEADSAGNETIAASIDENSQFFQAAKSTGLDATLAGAGPYTVLVPSDEAFAAVEGGALSDATNPQNRAEITRVLTYHILPGVILADDISKAIDNGEGGKAVLATMGGETLTATKEDGKIVLTDSAGTKATVGEADKKASNGVIHYIDALLSPPAAGGGEQNASQQEAPSQG